MYSLGQLSFRANLKVRLGSCLSLLSKWTTWTLPKSMHISKIFTACIWEGLITIHCQPAQLLPNSLTHALFHTQLLLTSLVYSNAAPTINCVFQLNQTSTQTCRSTWPRSPTRLGIRLRDLPTNAVLATVAFLVTCFHRSRHYSQLLDTTALTKLLRKISPKLIIMQEYGKFNIFFPLGVNWVGGCSLR